MFTSGIVVFLSAVLVLAKLPRRWLLRLLHYSLAVDLAVSAIVLALHFGTFSGVMAATFAGLLTSLATSAAKRAFGHIQGNLYFPGWLTLDVSGRA
ncbi:hypothetical protein [Quisquiliibacterium transsilvanicum]|uniref:NhaP-type Na+/H+ or K+/H+ antiporter n=1 Tax=Quisquiliibacterium transsilvanicum TaxID=1549638 RepID=A0A7W8HII8_9BURK|nr:hypothetical protein [Quisquiliibacterium transsilvanicum]MBB5271898.1 NhaP-type Na+/H+ or K+/H+ antiporter [Quisquiliibacterium transsilvanicum]